MAVRLMRWGSVVCGVASASWARLARLARPWPAAGATFVMVAALMVLPAISWLPQTSDAIPYLIALLAAQAAFAALTLTVAQFALHAVVQRPGVDERMYRAYIHAAGGLRSLWHNIAGLLVAFAVIVVQFAAVGGAPLISAAPGARNVLVVSAASFLFTLLIPVRMHSRSIRLNSPTGWWRLERTVAEADVRTAVDAFVAGDHVGGAPRDGSARDAVLRIRAAAAQAMNDRRADDLAAALATARDLLRYAMDALDAQGYRWGAPGAGASRWPPLAEISSTFHVLREQVFGHGEERYARELRALDWWMVREGIERSCGELLSAGLSGNNFNYSQAVSRRSLRPSLFGDVPLRALREMEAAGRGSGGELNEYLESYATHIVSHQEVLLSHALRVDDSLAFEAGVRNLRQMSSILDRLAPRPFAIELGARRVARVALMGLAGRAMQLHAEGRIASASPYLAPAREAYVSVDQLASDIVFALENADTLLSWSLWGAIDDSADDGGSDIWPRSFALLFFHLRLRELLTESEPTLVLGQHARLVRDAKEGSPERLGAYLVGVTAVSERRAQRAIEGAVIRESIADDERILAAALDSERLDALRANIYAAIFQAAGLEQAFARLGGQSYVQRAGAARVERSFHIPRGYLTALPGWGVMPKLVDLGRALEDDRSHDVFAALADAPMLHHDLRFLSSIPFRGNSALFLEELARVFDYGIRSLEAGPVLFLLTGSWRDLFIRMLHSMPNLSAAEAAPWVFGGVARPPATYRDSPILMFDEPGDNREVYAIDVSGWGCFERARAAPEADLLLRISEVSQSHAEALARAQHGNPSDGLDISAAIMRWRTQVECYVAESSAIKVLNPARARRITHNR